MNKTMEFNPLPSFAKRVPPVGGGCFRLPVPNISFRKHPSRGFYAVLSYFCGFSRATLFAKRAFFQLFYLVFTLFLLVQLPGLPLFGS